MMMVFSTLSVAFAAFVVWLAVRIINRRERWAKRTAMAVMAAAPVLYVLSFGPVCWMMTPQDVSAWNPKTRLYSSLRLVSVPGVYFPIGWGASRSDLLREVFARFAHPGGPSDVMFVIPTCWDCETVFGL